MNVLLNLAGEKNNIKTNQCAVEVDKSKKKKPKTSSKRRTFPVVYKCPDSNTVRQDFGVFFLQKDISNVFLQKVILNFAGQSVNMRLLRRLIGTENITLKQTEILTNTLHGFIYGALVWRTADITSSTVWIEALLTFCAKIAIKTCFTIVNFTLWKTQETQKGRIKIKRQIGFTHIVIRGMQFVCKIKYYMM